MKMVIALSASVALAVTVSAAISLSGSASADDAVAGPQVPPATPSAPAAGKTEASPSAPAVAPNTAAATSSPAPTAATAVVPPKPAPTVTYHADVYEHPNKGGRHVALHVCCDGKGGIPADQFEKNGLQDEISEVRYCLPEDAILILYTGRFWKDVDGDIPNFFNKQRELRAFIERNTGMVIGKFGETPLVLRGTGKEEVVRLWEVSEGKYDNKIRSAKIQAW